MLTQDRLGKTTEEVSTDTFCLKDSVYNNFSSLPFELKLEILVYLNGNSLAFFAMTCRDHMELKQYYLSSLGPMMETCSNSPKLISNLIDLFKTTDDASILSAVLQNRACNTRQVEFAILKNAFKSMRGQSLDVLEMYNHASSVERLEWSGQSLRGPISALLGSLSSLVNLNELTRLPDVLCNLIHLSKLDLFFNQFTCLPDSIGNLINLKKLNVGRNQLTRIPDSIGALTNLEFLNVSNNQLEFVPDSIGNLIQLQVLNLDGNKLTCIPYSLGNLASLRELFLENNQLDSIPESIGNLKKLYKLELHKNQLSNLPDSIGNLTVLVRLTFDNNPLASIPDSILQLLKDVKLQKKLNSK